MFQCIVSLKLLFFLINLKCRQKNFHPAQHINGLVNEMEKFFQPLRI
jgi:hypothetical protein